MVINVKQNQWQQEIKFENKEEIGSQETKGKCHAQKYMAAIQLLS